MFDTRRLRILKNIKIKDRKPVAYWMSRDQRVDDNWALIFAQNLAIEQKSPLIVVFCLVDFFLGATYRHFHFMLKGLKETSENLKRFKIPFVLLKGAPEEELPRFIDENNVSAIISDFDPLKIKLDWKKKILDKIKIPFYEVDAHNIIPCWVVSDKKEFSAFTFRNRYRKLIDDFLTDFPAIISHPFNNGTIKNSFDLEETLKNLKVDKKVDKVGWIDSGESGAKKILKKFLDEKIDRYVLERNDPSKDALSNLSPYLHFGQISAQRVALEVLKSQGDKKSKDAFLEELIIRRELADNFCYHEKNYDNFEGFPEWAKKTLNKHRLDKRPIIYSLEDLEGANTHDELWNSAQLEMVITGKMHGYLRMYWAKKILQWSETPEEALKIAIYLNDKYEIDGRDPNGYTGIAWSIGGVHDRPWKERDIFGMIRYMSYEGCTRKFNVAKYIEKIKKLT